MQATIKRNGSLINITTVLSLASFICLSFAYAQPIATPIQSAQADSVVQLTADSLGLPLILPGALPRSGTFFLMVPSLGGFTALPYPCPPAGYLPTYGIADGEFLVDGSGGQVVLSTRQFGRLAANTTVNSALELQANAVVNLIDMIQGAQLQQMTRTMGMNVPSFGDIGGGSADPSGPPDIPNYSKYMGQVFSLIDTNATASNDTNLYNALLAFPDSTNTEPRLQVLPYQNGLIFKASHFDYSGETARNFALVINDNAGTSLYKTIDLSNQTNNIQNGWLVQGTVPYWQVTDPMYLEVAHISKTYNAFFQAIPYGGPQIQLTGPEANSVVSNTITLQATITDLSGITNEPFELTVDGMTARYSIGSGNAISIETKYNPNGLANIYVNAMNNARVYDPSNPPDNSQIVFSGSTNLPLDFENKTYLAFGSDYASPDIGMNYFLYVTDQPHHIDATISDPANGQVVAHYAGYVPYAATIEIPWNFTEGDGVTAYSNDTYVVTFTAASDPDTFNTTNHIVREGVRAAAANILNYEEEDTSLSAGHYLNSQARLYINSLAYSYLSLYWDDFGSLTQYDPSQIGPNRDDPSNPSFPLVLTRGNEQSFIGQVLPAIANVAYSDFTYYMGHGNDYQIYGGPPGTNWVLTYLDSTTARSYAVAPSHLGHRNWRFRKVALWSCYSDSSPDFTASPKWPDAFGIRPTAQQNSNWIGKNVGLFFADDLAQGPYSGTYGGTSVEVASDFDLLWIGGPEQYPGGFDPTYSFAWALRQIRAANWQLRNAQPVIIGFPYVPFAGVYDSELLTNNVSHVKN